MKKGKLALFLAAAMTASTIGSVSFTSAAELQDIEVVEATDGADAAADGIITDEETSEMYEISDVADESVSSEFAADEAIISDDNFGTESGTIVDEPVLENIEVIESTPETAEESVNADEQENGIVLDSVEAASAEEVAHLDEVVEEDFFDSDSTISADANYTVTEGNGLYDADINGDVFTFTAPVSGVYKARLNVNQEIMLYRYGQKYDEASGWGQLVFAAQANEAVELHVKCNPEDYLKYRMIFERIPTVTGITGKQTGAYTSVLDDGLYSKFSATITYENGQSYTFDTLSGTDEYGYGIGYSVKNVAGEYVNYNRPGSYVAELYVSVSGYNLSGLKVSIPFTVNAFDPAAYQAITADMSYTVPAEQDYTWFTFTPSETAKYSFSVDTDDWDYDIYTYTSSDNGLQWASLSNLTAGTTYLVRMYSYGTAYDFKIKKPVVDYPEKSTVGELTLDVPVSGCYAYNGWNESSEAAIYTFTPQETGDYRLSADVKAHEYEDDVYCRLEYYYVPDEFDDESEEGWYDYRSDSGYDNLVIDSSMEKGTQYRYLFYGYSRYKFDAVLTKKKRLVDLYVAEKPAQKSIVRNLESLNYDGMKIVLTYDDNTTVTAVGKGNILVDAQGKRIDDIDIDRDNQKNSIKVTVNCAGYSDYFTIPVIAPEVAGYETIACNVQNTVILSANTSRKIYQFTSPITGKYVAEVNGDIDGYRDEVYYAHVEVLNEKGGYVSKLETGKMYYAVVYTGNIEEDYLLQDTTISLYIGDSNQSCIFAVTSETPATCTAEGQRVYTCTRHAAHETRTEVIPKLDHVKDAGAVTVQPTCQQEGKKVYKCTICGTEMYTEAVSKLDHVKDAGTVTVQPTCKKEGTRVYKCTVCGKELYREAISKLEHKKDKGTITTKPTAVQEGTRTYKCTVCGTKLSTSKIAKLKATMKVTASSIKLKVGQSTSKLKVTGLAKGDYVKYWKTNDKSVVTVTGKKTGTCTIKATKKAGSATITIFLASGKTQDIKVTVQKSAVATTKITGVQSKLTVKKGKSATLKPVLSPITSTEKITYTTSDKSIATVSSNGKIVGKKKGTATITVKAGKKSVKCKVTVK